MYVAMYGERVRELREEKGMSKRGLAAAADITPKTARRAERGEFVTRDTAVGIAELLGVTPRSIARQVRARS
jgi:transcriptional regulator with XRE-family HTH domain